MVDFRIPASIIMGQALLESGYGTSPLAVKANNHFGIKCKPEWTGKRYRYTDDKPHECFRSYNSAEDSYMDHAVFLANRIYYKSLFKLRLSDYKGWAYGLKKAGYATNPNYAHALIGIIERYGLQQLDRDAISMILLNEQKKAIEEERIALRNFDYQIPIAVVNYRPYELLSFNNAIGFNCVHVSETDINEVRVDLCTDMIISVACLRDEEEE